jgi:TRAP-type C4-dicarboxylate transport system substrate-binding protein
MKSLKMCIVSVVVLAAMLFIPISNFMLQGNTAFAADKPIKLKVLSSWGPDYAFVKVWLFKWIDKVNARSEGRLEVSFVGPEAVPHNAQLKPLSQGLFDFLYTHPAYHNGEISVANGQDGFYGTPRERRIFGFLEFFNEGYKTVNAKILGLSNGDVGFHAMLKKPLKSADFSGLKIRSTATYDPMIKFLGGSTVVSRPADVYSMLEKGIVDGACWPTIGALDYKWYEVTKYLLRPAFGQVIEILAVNLDTWNKLPEDLRKIIMQVTIEMDVEGYDDLTAYNKHEEEQLIKLGMKLNVLPPADGRKLRKIFYQQMFEQVVMKISGEYGPRMKQMSETYIRRTGQDWLLD